MVFERINLQGHLLDDNTLAKVLTALEQHGVSFKVRRLRFGALSEEASVIELELRAADAATMDQAL
ncbi:MAG TPA: hypothetical protein VM328_00770, partial [Fimbriimonadaceae bacterium]|nr:hypothetical protein [Fimbriimonadaceae bacterium]